MNGVKTEIAGVADELRHLRNVLLASDLVRPIHPEAAVTARTLGQVGLATDATGETLGDSSKDWGDAVHGLVDPQFFPAPFAEEPPR